MSDNLKSSVQSLLKNASFEAHGSEIHGEDFSEKRIQINSICATIPPNTNVYIPHAPDEEFDTVVNFSKAFKDSGLTPIPHICARRLDIDELERGLQELQLNGITSALILGGDVSQRETRSFTSTMDVLETGLLEKYGFKKILFGGHPEGNKLNPNHNDLAVLVEKLEYATDRNFETGIVTQASYNSSAVIEWVQDINAAIDENKVLSAAHTRPSIEIGIIGPASLSQKFDFARLCKIDTPLDILRKMNFGTAVDMILTNRPDNIIAEIASLPNSEDITLRFSTLGNIQDTLENYIVPVQKGTFETRRNVAGQIRFDIEPS